MSDTFSAPATATDPSQVSEYQFENDYTYKGTIKEGTTRWVDLMIPMADMGNADRAVPLVYPLANFFPMLPSDKTGELEHTAKVQAVETFKDDTASTFEVTIDLEASAQPSERLNLDRAIQNGKRLAMIGASDTWRDIYEAIVLNDTSNVASHRMDHKIPFAGDRVLLSTIMVPCVTFLSKDGIWQDSPPSGGPKSAPLDVWQGEHGGSYAQVNVYGTIKRN